eukprot:748939-Hanusia_phi.AAC.1
MQRRSRAAALHRYVRVRGEEEGAVTLGGGRAAVGQVQQAATWHDGRGGRGRGGHDGRGGRGRGGQQGRHHHPLHREQSDRAGRVPGSERAPDAGEVKTGREAEAVSGGVEYAMLSWAGDMRVVIQYAAKGSLPTVLEISLAVPGGAGDAVPYAVVPGGGGGAGSASLGDVDEDQRKRDVLDDRRDAGEAEGAAYDAAGECGEKRGRDLAEMELSEAVQGASGGKVR